jgi:hypothetical protein
MKLFMATCLKDYQEDVQKILKEAGIEVFSAAAITGFKTNQPLNMMEEWFATGDEKFDSTILFSFTDEKNSGQALVLIKEYNEQNKNNFPVRAFIVPVEQSVF